MQTKRERMLPPSELTRRWIHYFLGFLRRIVLPDCIVEGVERVPLQGSVVFVSHHPNGMFDGGVFVDATTRQASVLAKQPLFDTPISSHMLNALGALPVVRRQDKVQGDNRAMFSAVEAHLRRGGAISIYPEGISHDETLVMPLKTGAARIALGAQVDHLQPVSLYYLDKAEFRSGVIIRFGEPFAIRPEDDVASLTQRIREEIQRLTIRAEDRDSFKAIETAAHICINMPLAERFRVIESLWRAFPSFSDNKKSEILALCRRLREAHFRVSTPLILTEVAATILLSPIALVGFLTSWPIERLIRYLAERHSTDPDILPSSKLLGALLFYPLTWLILIGTVGWTHDTETAAMVGAGWPALLAARVLSVRPLRGLVHAMRRWSSRRVRPDLWQDIGRFQVMAEAYAFEASREAPSQRTS